MSEENLLTSTADECTASTNENPPPVDFVQVDIKIEKYDSEPEDIFEPEIRLVERASSPRPVDCKPDVGREANGHTAVNYPPEDNGGVTCAECGRVFKRARSLALHMRSHAARKYDAGIYICNRCQRSFTFKVNLIRHLRASPCTVRQKVDMVSCSVCQREFSSETNLRRHISTYHTERPHKCDLCGKMFKDTGAVFRHVLRHEKESTASKQFPCSECGKSFAIVNALECHLRTHTKERPFQCSLCVRAFSHKYNMMRHMRRHERVLHLKCEICHKVFPRESRLKYHMRVHMPDKKPYRCGQCPKTYSHQQNIIRHYTKKHPDVEYIPPATDAEFANKAWKLRMEQSVALDNQEYILPEFQDGDTHLKEKISDTEKPVQPEMVIVNNNNGTIKIEPETVFNTIQIKVEPYCEIKQEIGKIIP